MADFALPSTHEPLMAEVVELDYAPPALQPRRWGQTVLAWLAAVTTLVGTLLIFVSVETVIGSGPALATSGIVLLILGMVQRSLWASALGAAHIAVCLFFFGLVFLNSWSPREAESPFRVLSVAYCLVALVATGLFTWHRRPRTVLT